MIKGFLSSSTGLWEDGGGLEQKKQNYLYLVKMYRYNKNQVKKILTEGNQEISKEIACISVIETL